MHKDVIWANGMEGGHVHGRDQVRSYWTQCEVETSITRCRICAWEMQLVRKQSDSAKEQTTNLDNKKTA